MAWATILQTLQELEEDLRGFHDQRNFYDIWNYPAVRVTPAGLARPLRSLIWKAHAASSLVPNSHPDIEFLTQLVQTLKDVYLPQLYSNQLTHFAFLHSLQVANGYLDELLGVDGVNKALGIPRNLSSKVRSASVVLDRALEDMEGIDERIKAIRSAHDAAVDLPVTLRDIEEAKKQLDSARIVAASRQAAMEGLLDQANKVFEDIERHAQHAESTAGRVDDSYRALTSQGLAQAFHHKEKRLNRSILIWVGLLLAALGCMGWIGYLRFPGIQAALGNGLNAGFLASLTASTAAQLKLAAGEPRWGVVLVEIVLAILSLGPPTWLAIISTKQIGQRFKLAEDYGYKAAVSAAYEGYRTEAGRYGESFQTKLFTSALDRLDEQPLRFVDHEVGGSPIHELINSLSKIVDAKILKEIFDKLPAVPGKGKSKKSTSEGGNDEGTDT